MDTVDNSNILRRLGIQKNRIMITFDSDNDRVKGIGTLFKSPYSHTALGKNRYSVDVDVIESKLFENHTIRGLLINKFESTPI